MTTNLEKAIWFATMMHHEQEYDSKPYTYHLQQVTEILKRFGFDDEVLITSAWLHDIIEDVSSVNFTHLKVGFGKEIADIVFSVTNTMGRNRDEKFKYTYPKIKENRKALILKLSDRIANIETGLANGDVSYTEMYRHEWPEFQKALYDENEQDDRIKKMWEHLTGLFDGYEKKRGIVNE
jgi:(p)ppGpp synthase/HD superfamily hydrolase